jgi:hypothetical protein
VRCRGHVRCLGLPGLHATPHATITLASNHASQRSNALHRVFRDLERLFQAAATGFSCDSAQETRNSGKRLLVALRPLMQVSPLLFQTSKPKSLIDFLNLNAPFSIMLSLQRAGSWDRLNNLLPPADASRVAAIIEKVRLCARAYCG